MPTRKACFAATTDKRKMIRWMRAKPTKIRCIWQASQLTKQNKTKQKKNQVSRHGRKMKKKKNLSITDFDKIEEVQLPIAGSMYRQK